MPACDTELELFRLRGSLPTVILGATSLKDLSCGGHALFTPPLTLLYVALTERGSGTWDTAGIGVLKLPCPIHMGLTTTLESVPPPSGICGIINVGNVAHSGALSLDDSPCFDDLLTPLLSADNDLASEAGRSLSGDLEGGKLTAV